MPLHIFDIVQFRSKRILDIDNDDFPVGLAFVEERHNTENLDLLNLSGVTNLFSDLADIERVIVALGLGFGMGGRWVFPSLTNYFRNRNRMA